MLCNNVSMPSTHSNSNVAGLNLGWVRTAPQHCNKESELLRLNSDTCSLSPIRNRIHWHNAAQHFKCGRVPGASQQPVRQYCPSFHHVDDGKFCILFWYFATDRFQKTFEVRRS
jgi:hypothetical protein